MAGSALIRTGSIYPDHLQFPWEWTFLRCFFPNVFPPYQHSLALRTHTPTSPWEGPTATERGGEDCLLGNLLQGRRLEGLTTWDLRSQGPGLGSLGIEKLREVSLGPGTQQELGGVTLCGCGQPRLKEHSLGPDHSVRIISLMATHFPNWIPARIWETLIKRRLFSVLLL